MAVITQTLGLGLGVAPLLVELLKRNPEPVHALKATKTKHVKEMMSEFYENLQFEVAMLKITLTKLVTELPIANELKKKLTDEKSLDPTVWKTPSPELQCALERRLNPCLDLFVQDLEKLLRLLSKLVDDKSLPLPLAGNEVRVCTGTPYAKLEEFFDKGLTVHEKLRIGWKKDKRDELMERLQKYNRRLDKMVERTSKPHNTRTPQQRSTTGFIPDLRLRQMVSSLRKSIGGAWCKCFGKHELRLGLSKIWNKNNRVRMDMIMNLSKNSSEWSWGESKIDIFLQESPPSRAVIFPPDHRSSEQLRRSSTNFSGSTCVENLGTSLPSTLASAHRNASTRMTSGNEEEEGTQRASRLSDTSHSRILIDDICAAVQKTHRVRRASQLIFDDDKLWHKSTPVDCEILRSHPGIRLDSFLHRGKLRMRDRKILQVLLAQSVLFFPWEGQDLNRNSIAFHQNSPFAKFVPDHGRDLGAESTDSVGPESFQFKTYNNETLAALATILLELELEKPVEELKTDADLDDSSLCIFEINCFTAMRVLKEQEFNMFKGCYDAIDACFRCDFEGHPPTLDDPDFLQHVYKRIVAPLEHELWRGFGLRLPFLEAPDPDLESGLIALDISRS